MRPAPSELRLGQAAPQDAPDPVRVTRPRRLVLRLGALGAAAARVVRRAAVARGLRAVRRLVVAAAGVARFATRRRVVVLRVAPVRRARVVARAALVRRAVVRRAGLRPG
ncbi:MAG: hypothetical protein ACLQNU_02440 [Candidatus Dormibacteria bacterium]